MAEQAGAEMPVHRVWALAYDGDPRMDGSHERRQLAERTSLDQVQKHLENLRSRGGERLYHNLRIETRMVTDWVRVPGNANNAGEG